MSSHLPHISAHVTQTWNKNSTIILSQTFFSHNGAQILTQSSQQENSTIVIAVIATFRMSDVAVISGGCRAAARRQEIYKYPPL